MQLNRRNLLGLASAAAVTSLASKVLADVKTYKNFFKEPSEFKYFLILDMPFCGIVCTPVQVSSLSSNKLKVIYEYDSTTEEQLKPLYNWLALWYQNMLDNSQFAGPFAVAYLEKFQLRRKNIYDLVETKTWYSTQPASICWYSDSNSDFTNAELTLVGQQALELKL
jgi:hypothetical protein